MGCGMPTSSPRSGIYVDPKTRRCPQAGSRVERGGEEGKEKGERGGTTLAPAPRQTYHSICGCPSSTRTSAPNVFLGGGRRKEKRRREEGEWFARRLAALITNSRSPFKGMAKSARLAAAQGKRGGKGGKEKKEEEGERLGSAEIVMTPVMRGALIAYLRCRRERGEKEKKGRRPITI